MTYQRHTNNVSKVCIPLPKPKSALNGSHATRLCFGPIWQSVAPQPPRSIATLDNLGAV
eukprot:CAMPEP_0169146380 /NCGR_PEP_ID=MMETSP1015-20121227/47525_1 /TAXON_ID=342587 /ORGANISM="Karlodinium micrum, Strain CCMP2283" /LENGTH=58 /DNA_ID=CAMNT_0009214255 /DNA_START=306 /DNA_END=478 /DNA_ORIENTATION=-